MDHIWVHSLERDVLDSSPRHWMFDGIWATVVLMGILRNTGKHILQTLGTYLGMKSKSLHMLGMCIGKNTGKHILQTLGTCLGLESISLQIPGKCILQNTWQAYLANTWNVFGLEKYRFANAWKVHLAKYVASISCKHLERVWA